ncbi:uncharacterized protein E6C27_scaffold1639G00520 [Cucumis melo var. makuwa]|uniref:CACTA en-spm transposon protein n=1 Tax=Cucumis melo var. makuwa TaxID=1194695 RepID=A0A5A7TJI4_CUCMM|nr:uncharacterized protein E6C27_scaffold1639G00520 [Cucumis melo var. makuwa]
MRWHRDNRVETDDVLRHSADAEGLKHFNSEFLDFASDPQNVHLGLALDGFNPFGQMSTSYSMWPVVLLLYNLPPWKCMKETNFFMSLLIPYPRSLGREIDVYLQPLIEELKELWTFGVHTYDYFTCQFFQLYAVLLWMINDFPAYDDLSRWSTKSQWAHSNDDTRGAEKPISPHVVRFSQAIGVCVRKTFSVCCLKWANVGREYIKVVKGDLQRFFVLDFNDQAMNRFIEHQMLSTFKEFRVDCHRHFKKYNDPEEARANPLKLSSQPTPKASRPLSGDEICDKVLSRRPDYSKGLSWGSKSKARKTTSTSSSSMSRSQSTKRELELQAKLDKALEWIKVQDRNHQVLASEVEQMQKLIQDMTRYSKNHHMIPSFADLDVKWRERGSLGDV